MLCAYMNSSYNQQIIFNETVMDCLFCKIVSGVIKTTILAEDDKLLAFSDISPQAPKHFLIIPKKHIATINDCEDADTLLLGKMIITAKKLACIHNQEGYRLVFNTDKLGGQAVYHIHLHLLAGRQMQWPPG